MWQWFIHTHRARRPARPVLENNSPRTGAYKKQYVLLNSKYSNNTQVRSTSSYAGESRTSVPVDHCRAFRVHVIAVLGIGILRVSHVNEPHHHVGSTVLLAMRIGAIDLAEGSQQTAPPQRSMCFSGLCSFVPKLWRIEGVRVHENIIVVLLSSEWSLQYWTYDVQARKV